MAESRPTFSNDHDACGVGFIAQLGGPASHAVVERGLKALERLAHRGGVDADGRSGDGAGLLVGLPKTFFREVADLHGIELPHEFGVGMVFLQRGQEERAIEAIRDAAPKFGLSFLGWREVPTNASILGPRSKDSLPAVRQCFIASLARSSNQDADDFELQLFRLRQVLEAIPGYGYYCSLSSRTVVYKGLLTPGQLAHFYPEMVGSQHGSAFVMFHQRDSTNTQPSWSLAQPFRFVAHNGEINTISGNRRWLRAKAAAWRQKCGLSDRVRLLEEKVSDSASFDNGVELLLRQGYSPAEAMLCMVPPAWERSPEAVPELRNFLEECARLQEPWDGPAALIFSDGCTVGAKLDRNGLRPLRYTLTSDGLLVVGSEVGIADLDGKQVIERQRLGPGEILLVNPASGAFVRPEDSLRLREGIRAASPVPPVLVAPTDRAFPAATPEPKQVMAALGWSEDQFRLLFQPLVEQGQEAVWSMGDDAPPASLSSLRRPLWDYCKQRLAQVTNTPIDSLRESNVMSLKVLLGRAALQSPLLDGGQLERLQKELGTSERMAFTFPVDGTEEAKAALARLQKDVRAASANNPGLIILTDRGVDTGHAALPALLVLAAAWQWL